LRDEISAAITDRLLTSWRGGETVNAASLREFATEIASEIVSENVVAYSAAYEDERAHHNQL
jgi:hypothetical protein